nr:TonB-dependent siderophore receptor [Alteromonas sp. 5E99-2]
MAQEGSDESNTTNLETITVTSERYLEEVATSATKTNTSVIETPQSIVTITRAQIDHQNSQTVSEALRYSSGVLSDVESTSRNDSVFLRGFGGFGTSTTLVSFLDGLRLPRGQAFAQFSIDPFLLDRIEIIKGPSAVLYGQISPGGLINQISRKPTYETENTLRAELGSNNRYQVGITSRGAIDEEGKFTYSLASIGRKSGTRFDNVDEERVAVAPSLTWNPSSDTSLTVGGFYSSDPEGGIFNSALARDLAPEAYRSALGPNLNFGDAGAEGFDREQYGIGYELDHHYNNISLHSALRYSHIDIDFAGVQFIAPLTTEGLLPRAAIQSDENAKGVNADNRILVNFSTGAVNHQFMVGVDYLRNTADWLYSFGQATSLDVVNPVYNQPVGPFVDIVDNSQTQTQTGFYIQDQIDIANWRLTLGARHDSAELETYDNFTDTVSEQKDTEVSYRAGLLYLFDFGLAPYISYSTSFEPTIGVGEDGNEFQPTTARQFEAGIKYQPSKTSILVTSSIFDIEQDNVLTPSSTFGFSVQDGKIRSRGLEFEVRGNVTENLELIASSTWLDTEVTESSVQSVVGKRPQAVPERFASVWASYRIPVGPLTGLNVGGGVRYVSDSYGDDLNTLRSPSYTVFDLALRYNLKEINPSWDGIDLTFNVSNLFNKEYYTSCSFDIYCQFGNLRQTLVGINYEW